MSTPRAIDGAGASPCQSCGACCNYSSEWPRFTIEDDATIARLPAEFINDADTGMRCDGDRCLGLDGTIGLWTACTVYADRPVVCRECVAGDHACTMAREAYGMPAIEVGEG